MEHCRFSQKRYLFIYHKSVEPCPEVKLDLGELISFPKQCCYRGCIKDGKDSFAHKKYFSFLMHFLILGLISCSLCKIACWCGPDCLENDFATHKMACTVAEYILQELQL